MTEQNFVDNENNRVVSNSLAVYRNLRIGMGAIAVVLAASIIVQSFFLDGLPGKSCWQGALSEYFYTSAHSIFVASLLGLAILFFIYRGTCDTENALLALAGVAALTAALVPQGRSYIKLCKPLFIPKDVPIEGAIRANLVAVVAGLAVALVIMWFQRYYPRTDQAGNPIPLNARQKRSPGGNWAQRFLWLVVVLGLIGLCFPASKTQDIAHTAAGILLLSSFIATACVTAYLSNREVNALPKHHGFYKGFYKWWAILMLVTFFGIIAGRPMWVGDHWGTCLEGAILLEFCVYWVVQTFDLWDTPDRRYRLSDADRNRLAQTDASEPDVAGDTSIGAKVMALL